MIYSPNQLIFRNANKNDINEILSIHNSNAIGNRDGYGKKGFLLEETNYTVVLNNLKSPNDNYYVSADKTDTILGYVYIKKKIDRDILSRVQFTNDSYNKLILSGRHFYIAVVAIKPDIVGRGVGRYIYEQLFLEYSDCVFTAFVATKPYKNLRSFDFHIKQGFQIVGRYNNDNFCGLKNYESLLFLKKV